MSNLENFENFVGRFRVRSPASTDPVASIRSLAADAAASSLVSVATCARSAAISAAARSPPPRIDPGTTERFPRSSLADTRLARAPNRNDEIVSAVSVTSGERHTTSVALAFPPNDSCRRNVSLESL